MLDLDASNFSVDDGSMIVEIRGGDWNWTSCGGTDEHHEVCSTMARSSSTRRSTAEPYATSRLLEEPRSVAGINRPVSAHWVRARGAIAAASARGVRRGVIGRRKEA